MFTEVLDASDTHAIHSLHPYPAKYIPQLPRGSVRKFVYLA